MTAALQNAGQSTRQHLSVPWDKKIPQRLFVQTLVEHMPSVHVLMRVRTDLEMFRILFSQSVDAYCALKIFLTKVGYLNWTGTRVSLLVQSAVKISIFAFVQET